MIQINAIMSTSQDKRWRFPQGTGHKKSEAGLGDGGVSARLVIFFVFACVHVFHFLNWYVFFFCLFRPYVFIFHVNFLCMDFFVFPPPLPPCNFYNGPSLTTPSTMAGKTSKLPYKTVLESLSLNFPCFLSSLVGMFRGDKRWCNLCELCDRTETQDLLLELACTRGQEK